VKAIHVTK